MTGSSNVLLIPRLSDSLAGRMEIIRLHPLSQVELEHYVETLIQRDVRDLSRIESLDALPKLLALAAGQTARLANLSELASEFELSRITIRSYLTLIERLFLLEFLTPWFTNRAKRLIKTPKLHFGDTGLACSLLRCGQAELEQQRELLGQLLETFVFGEVAKQAGAYPERIALHHLRDKDGYEVDIVVQCGTRYAGLEIKAASSVRVGDFSGLKRLRELLGSRFHSGIVLYEGEHVLPFGERLLAVPLSALWARNRPSGRRS